MNIFLSAAHWDVLNADGLLCCLVIFLVTDRYKGVRDNQLPDIRFRIDFAKKITGLWR